MSTIVSYDPLGPQEPPFSPTMERAFTEAFADISDMELSDDQGVVIKVEMATVPSGWSGGDHAATTNLRIATPPPSAVNLGLNHEAQLSKLGGMSPSEKQPATFKDTAEEKRSRRSAIEKKSRQRRQTVVKRMKSELKQLEVMYAEMAKKEPSLVGLVQWCSLSKEHGPSAMNELQQKYSELTLMVHSLEEDQAALQKLLDEHDTFQKTVKSLSIERQSEGTFEIWDNGVPPSSSFAAKFKKLTTAQGYAFVRDTYEDIKKFTESENFATTGASFMGWTDKRKYSEKSNTLQYSFTKQFPFEDTERVFKKSWENQLDASKLAQMVFDSSVQSRCEVFQVLSDDLMIIRRDYRIPSFPTTFTSVQALFRLQTPTGYTICVWTVPSPEIKSALEEHEYLFELFHWTHFNRLYDEFDNPAGCEIVAAGSMDQTKIMSNYWLFEIVCTTLRWESLTVAPLFTIET